MKEFLFDEVLNLDPNNNELVSLEILLQNNRRFIPITQRVPFISLKNALEFDLNINMKSLTKSTSSNENICLKDIIITYNQHFNINPMEFYKKQYNQVFLRELSLFIKNKIQNERNQKNHTKKYSLELAQTRGLLNNFGEKIKLNQKIKFQALYSNRNHIFMLIHQTVLTIKPKQIASILFCKEKTYFIIFIYHNKDCTYFKQKISRKKIIYYIPNLEEMITLELMNELGDRIFKVFKNSLLFTSYYKTKLTY